MHERRGVWIVERRVVNGADVACAEGLRPDSDQIALEGTQRVRGLGLGTWLDSERVQPTAFDAGPNGLRVTSFSCRAGRRWCGAGATVVEQRRAARSRHVQELRDVLVEGNAREPDARAQKRLRNGAVPRGGTARQLEKHEPLVQPLPIAAPLRFVSTPWRSISSMIRGMYVPP